MISLYIAGGLLALLAALIWLAMKYGGKDNHNRKLENDIKAGNEAKLIHDRLNHDPDYAKRVRERFKR